MATVCPLSIVIGRAVKFFIITWTQYEPDETYVYEGMVLNWLSSTIWACVGSVSMLTLFDILAVLMGPLIIPETTQLSNGCSATFWVLVTFPTN